MKTTTSFILRFAVAVFLAAVSSCFSADKQYEECLAPLRCGPGLGILRNGTYPFWGVNKPNYCGQTEFQLSCKNDLNLILDLKTFSFLVLSFDLENQTLTVANESLFEGRCPSISLNFTETNQFTIAPTSKKIDLFICPVPEMTSHSVPECVKLGEVPVLSSVLDDFQRSRLTLEEALVKGFDLRYNIRYDRSCRGCSHSGGVCGSELVSGSFRCLCTDKPHNFTCNDEGARNVWMKIIIGAIGGGLVIVLVIIALMLQKVKTCCVREQNLEALVPLKRYSYAQVKKMTKSFRHEVGKGGFGVVYKGNFCDGRKVAVKVLKDSKGNGEDFINEVASMSRTSHINIVTLLGFCYEGSKRAIIYEFLENGSLDKFISSKKSSNMDWGALYGIALGVARGLEYLHNGCRARIVHFDIKPQNVLLDDNLCPKVSDFGLAKLCEKKESILSLLDTRGTIGYIAPEVFSRMYGRVSHKSDVYSYGMLVLEMIGARNKSIEDSASNTSSMYFPEWIYKDLEKGYNKRLVENEITSEEEEIVRKMTLVGLWCIQSSPSNRPPMNRVVEMLEGSLNALEVPPKPVLQHISAAPLSEYFGMLGESSITSECGNITADFPFWGGSRHKPCGHPLLELHCNNNITSLFISNQEFYVRQLNQTSNILTLARSDLLGSFCSSSVYNTTTLPPEIFELSPTYKSLTVLYHCDPKLSYRSSYTCPALGTFSVSQSLDYQYSCQDSFLVNVPTSFNPEERGLNLTNLESSLRKGFEVKLVIDEIPCQECLSTRGICGFNSTTQICCNVTSPSGGVTCVPQHQPSADELYRRCSESFSCGSQRNLNYPLWKPGREDCGHPNFKLNCSGGFAEINIASVKFRIIEAYYSLIRLARSDYIGDFCPANPLHAPFIEKFLPVLQFTGETELLTFYYGCRFNSSDIPANIYVGELGCDEGRSYYVTRNLSSPLLDGFRSVLNNFSEMCKRNVSVPASGPALNDLQTSPNPDNLKMALDQGFRLLVTSECERCRVSGGACGYNQTSSGFGCYCKDGKCRYDGKGFFRRHQYLKNVVMYILIALGSLTGLVIIFLVLLCPYFRVQIFRKRQTSHDLRLQKLKALIPLKHYTYAEVKKITKSFKEVIGRGGFGIVYRGTLCDSRMVAVKVLKDSKGTDGEDFINEVASMSQTSHVNIVSLLGFCCEGSKRAIIYEFLSNGSLDKFISDKSSISLDLTALYGIALGVSRGLEYLHYGCKTRIVHFDIKPQNVLLDDNLCPKVSDFGLAKLCEKKESILSLLDTRGTIGYIAPEMISRVYGSVSHKSDVYSYGMLVLEMIGARKKERFDQNPTSNASSIYFPEWIYKDLEKADSEDIEKTDNGGLIENGISSEEEEIARKMTLVGLWCIQCSPSNRPPMNRVVEMMEGSLEALEVPPRPVLQQIPAAPLSESFWISEENSSASDTLICSTNSNLESSSL
ncbi:Protein kinase-like domain superfamily [Arabidopsis suecica]|uniref:non-specific serine/threonine protein kinase n=1 Tax=Arabidopsis suecica TaxID=45249 RepID=A0A8T2BRV2_ARASU|nr:Protein kinase-like domain superfamily [Arabidopsis suecica]